MYIENKEQIKSANELCSKKRAILTEPCGVGKTVISLLAAKKLNLPAYVVCPASVKDNWVKDANLVGFSNLKISSWASFPKNKKLWASLPKGIFIVDEAHHIGTTIKNRDRGKAVILFAKSNPYCFLLSATPSKHRPLDFYWLLKLCGLHTMDRESYRFKYCGAYYHPHKRTMRGQRILLDSQPTNLPELLNMFAKVNVQNSTRKVNINKKIYVFPDTKFVDPLFSEIARLRREAGKEKFDQFISFMKKRELFNKPLIFFTYHREITEKLAKLLDCGYIIGGQSKTKRQENLKKILTKRQGVVSLRAGGQGINELKDFDTCYFVEASYSPATDMQAYMRMVRGREDKTINVNWIISKNEHTYLVNKEKQAYFEEVLNL